MSAKEELLEEKNERLKAALRAIKRKARGTREDLCAPNGFDRLSKIETIAKRALGEPL